MGGRANLLEKDGFRRDMGPSRYLMPDMFEEFFESIGEDIHKRLDLKQLSPSYRIFPKGQIQHSNGNDDGKNNIGIEYDAPAIKQELSQLYAHAFSNETFGIGYDSDYFESHIEDRSTRKDWRAVIYRDPESNSLIGFSTGFGDGTYILDNCEPEILLSKLQEKGVDMNAIYRIDDGIVSPDFR
jgi:phytoene dehydrogenase-like protein